jgi:hypothetical protein
MEGDPLAGQGWAVPGSPGAYIPDLGEPRETRPWTRDSADDVQILSALNQPRIADAADAGAWRDVLLIDLDDTLSLAHKRNRLQDILLGEQRENHDPLWRNERAFWPLQRTRLMPLTWALTADTPPPTQLEEHLRSGLYGSVILPLPLSDGKRVDIVAQTVDGLLGEALAAYVRSGGALFVIEGFSGPGRKSTLLPRLGVRLGLDWHIYSMENVSTLQMALHNFRNIQRCFGGRTPMSSWRPPLTEGPVPSAEGPVPSTLFPTSTLADLCFEVKQMFMMARVPPEHQVCVLLQPESGDEGEPLDEPDPNASMLGDTAVACAQVGRGHFAYTLLTDTDNPILGLAIKFARHAGAGVPCGLWSVAQNRHFPRPARERARALLVLGAQLDRRRGLHEESLLDVWIAYVMPGLVSADWLRVGCSVRIAGLVRAAQWNGRYAIVVGYRGDRIAVQVQTTDRPPAGESVRVCAPLRIVLEGACTLAAGGGRPRSLLVLQANLHVVT